MAEPVIISVDLELTNHCGNRCAMCPRDAIARPKGFMTEAVLERVMDVLGPAGPLITLSGMGDPLAHPRALEFVRRLRASGLDVGLVVHPKALANPGVPEALVEAGPNQVTVSFPSLRSEVLRVLLPDAGQGEALAAVRRLGELARGRMGLRVSGLLTRLNHDEGPEFQAFWRAEGIEAWVRRCHSRGGHLEAPEIHTSPPSQGAGSPCGLLAFHTFVTWEGEVLACCHDLSGETRLGSLARLGPDGLLGEKRQALARLPHFALCGRCDEPLRGIEMPEPPPEGGRKARRRLFRALARQSAFQGT